jgi:pimeloyl-ACP methyl ester carboxylesterase
VTRTRRTAAGPADFTERFAKVNGVRLRYLIGGRGSPVVLLHGYAETGHMWRPIMPLLAQRHTVIVPDLRGAGGSAKPAAAQFREAAERVVLMDAFLPGIGSWKDVWLLRDLWHFHFYGEVPLALVKGRERTYLEHFWNDFAADRKHSVPEADRRLYARAYAQPGAMRAGFEYFRNFERDALDFARMGSTRLSMPMLVLSGEKAGGTFLIEQAKLVASDVRGQVVAGAGHWLMEEAPTTVIPAIIGFVG